MKSNMISRLLPILIFCVVQNLVFARSSIKNYDNRQFIDNAFKGLVHIRPASSINDKSGNEMGNKLMMNYYEYQPTIIRTKIKDTLTIPQTTTENQQINIATTVNEDTNNAQIISEVTTENQLPDFSTTVQEETNDEQTISKDTRDNNQHSDITTLKEETTNGEIIPEVTTENQLADLTTTVKEESETTTTNSSYDYNPFSENFSLPNSTRQASKIFKFKFLNSRVTLSKPFNIKITNPFLTYTIKLTKSIFINAILPQLISFINILRLIKSNFQFWINIISLLM